MPKKTANLVEFLMAGEFLRAIHEKSPAEYILCDAGLISKELAACFWSN